MSESDDAGRTEHPPDIPTTRQAERGRRADANKLNDAARRFYRELWDVKNLADVEDEAGEFSHRSDRKSALQLLEYADVDVIVDCFDDIYLIQEKFVMPDTRGDSLLIRYDNGSNTVAPESERLIKSVDDPTTAVPGIIAYGRAESETSFEWFRLVDTHAFVTAWRDDSNDCAPFNTFRNTDGTASLMFSPEAIEASGAVITRWGIE